MILQMVGVIILGSLFGWCLPIFHVVIFALGFHQELDSSTLSETAYKMSLLLRGQDLTYVIGFQVEHFIVWHTTAYRPPLIMHPVMSSSHCCCFVEFPTIRAPPVERPFYQCWIPFLLHTQMAMPSRERIGTETTFSHWSRPTKVVKSLNSEEACEKKPTECKHIIKTPTRTCTLPPASLALASITTGRHMTWHFKLHTVGVLRNWQPHSMRDGYLYVSLRILRILSETQEFWSAHSGGSGILAFILVLLLQGWYVLKIPSKLKHDSKKKEESSTVERP